MATNISLNKLLKTLLKQKFLGVFPIHYGLRKIKNMKIRQSLLINSGCVDKMENGHFFAVIKTGKSKLLVFDSLCNEETVKNLLNPVLNRFQKVQINKEKVQSDESNYCGIFASAFVLTYYKKRKFPDFFEMLEYNNLINNDHIISDYLTKLVKNIVRE